MDILGRYARHYEAQAADSKDELMTATDDIPVDQRGFDYSLTVNGREQHFPVAPSAFESRADALRIAEQQSSQLTSPGEVVIVTYRAGANGLSADTETIVEHRRG